MLHDIFAVPFARGDPAAGEVVDAFLAASRAGDFDRLLALLDPGAVVRADAAAVRMGSEELVSGAQSVAETFAGRAQAARLALVDGAPGAAWVHAGQTKVAFGFTVVDRRITEIELLADPDVLSEARVQLA